MKGFKIFEFLLIAFGDKKSSMSKHSTEITLHLEEAKKSLNWLSKHNYKKLFKGSQEEYLNWLRELKDSCHVSSYVEDWARKGDVYENFLVDMVIPNDYVWKSCIPERLIENEGFLIKYLEKNRKYVISNDFINFIVKPDMLNNNELLDILISIDRNWVYMNCHNRKCRNKLNYSLAIKYGRLILLYFVIHVVSSYVLFNLIKIHNIPISFQQIIFFPFTTISLFMSIIMIANMFLREFNNVLKYKKIQNRIEKIKVNEKIVEKFECIICMDESISIPSEQYFNCDHNNLMCTFCYIKCLNSNNKKCPYCRSSLKLKI